MTILIVVLAAIAIILIVAALKPDSYSIERATTIAAPPDSIFPLIIDFRQWPRWSSFETIDPAAQRTYSGAATGTGAVYEWIGNSRAGMGRMEITGVAPPRRATVRVDFAKPFVAHNVNEFVLDSNGGSTAVTWTMRGTRPFMLKIMSVFVSPDRLMGTHFESGLSSLKAAVESDAIKQRAQTELPR